MRISAYGCTKFFHLDLKYPNVLEYSGNSLSDRADNTSNSEKIHSRLMDVGGIQ